MYTNILFGDNVFLKFLAWWKHQVEVIANILVEVSYAVTAAGQVDGQIVVIIVVIVDAAK